MGPRANQKIAKPGWDYIWLLWLGLIGVLLIIRPSASPSANEVAYFQFDYPPDPERFIFQSSDPTIIAEARDILANNQVNRHVMGRIVKQPAPYNPPWSYHLDPGSVSFFDRAIEICDATIANVEARLEEACGSFLPGCEWCPWGSRLLAEVTPGPPEPTPEPDEAIYLPIVFR